MRTTVLTVLSVHALVLAAAAAGAAPPLPPVLAPDLGVDSCFLTAGDERAMGLAPGRLRLRALPVRRGRIRTMRAGRRIAAWRAARLHRWWTRPSPDRGMFNRSERLLLVSREHAEPVDPGWEAGLSRLRNLKAVADVELRAGRPLHAAIAAWRQVTRDPDDAMARLLLSDATFLLGNRDFAGEEAREGLRRAPGLLRARLDKRGFLDDPAPLEAAIASLAADLRTDPGTAYERFLLGYQLLFTGRPAEAVDHLRAAAEAWPWDPVPRMALAVARERAGS